METKLEKLIKIRDLVEDMYTQVTRMIKSEQLANALVVLANNEGVMLMLDEQKLADNIMKEIV